MSFESLQRNLPSQFDARKFDAYYNNEARLDALGVNIPPEARILEMVVPWPRLSIDVLVEVLTFVGYTLGSDPNDPRLKYLKSAFQANNMNTGIRLALTDALVQGGSYWLVGKGRKYPRITSISADDAAIERDEFGDISEAVVRWRVGASRFDRRLSHYQRGRTDVYASAPTGWEHIDKLSGKTDIDEVPVVPMLNKARTSDHLGRSELIEVMKLSDAGSRTLTGLQVAQELEAMPKRWIFADGITKALEESGKSKLEAYMGYLNFGPEGGKVQQLNGAALDPLINSFKLYAQIVSSITGIPPSMLGISTDNPSSAEAMRVAKERLTTRGEAKQSMFGDSLEDLARIVLLMGGQDTDDLESLESVWRDVATPSKSSQQAMALQAFQSGAISARTMRDFLDLTPAQRQREDDRELMHSGMPRREVNRVTGNSRGDSAGASDEAASSSDSDDEDS